MGGKSNAHPATKACRHQYCRYHFQYHTNIHIQNHITRYLSFVCGKYYAHQPRLARKASTLSISLSPPPTSDSTSASCIIDIIYIYITSNCSISYIHYITTEKRQLNDVSLRYQVKPSLLKRQHQYESSDNRFSSSVPLIAMSKAVSWINPLFQIFFPQRKGYEWMCGMFIKKNDK